MTILENQARTFQFKKGSGSLKEQNQTDTTNKYLIFSDKKMVDESINRKMMFNTAELPTNISVRYDKN